MLEVEGHSFALGIKDQGELPSRACDFAEFWAIGHCVFFVLAETPAPCKPRSPDIGRRCWRRRGEYRNHPADREGSEGAEKWGESILFGVATDLRRNHHRASRYASRFKFLAITHVPL